MRDEEGGGLRWQAGGWGVCVCLCVGGGGGGVETLLCIIKRFFFPILILSTDPT